MCLYWFVKREIIINITIQNTFTENIHRGLKLLVKSPAAGRCLTFYLQFVGQRDLIQGMKLSWGRSLDLTGLSCHEDVRRCILLFKILWNSWRYV